MQGIGAAYGQAIEALSARSMVLETLIHALLHNPAICSPALLRDFDQLATALEAQAAAMPFSEAQIDLIRQCIDETRGQICEYASESDG
jgi:hypothetical protein